MRQIINSLLDNDLYTFSVCYAYLQKFPRAIGQYTFVDRNNTVYPKGFAEKLREQFDLYGNLRITFHETEMLLFPAVVLHIFERLPHAPQRGRSEPRR